MYRVQVNFDGKSAVKNAIAQVKDQNPTLDARTQNEILIRSFGLLRSTNKPSRIFAAAMIRSRKITMLTFRYYSIWGVYGVDLKCAKGCAVIGIEILVKILEV